ncbi:MAG TPA: hypothetical protein VMZ74_10000 [Ramlibacter sp.]|nr:hypothetical protein [Ramlibacter sp.]
MNPNRTISILQRLPIILAVTAASYGIAQPQPLRPAGTAEHVKVALPQR